MDDVRHLFSLFQRNQTAQVTLRGMARVAMERFNL
jgi:hypothetical protein